MFALTRSLNLAIKISTLQTLLVSNSMNTKILKCDANLPMTELASRSVSVTFVFDRNKPNPSFEKNVCFFQRCASSSITFLSAHFSCLMPFTNRHFPPPCNPSAWEWSNAVVTGALLQCLFSFRIVCLYHLTLLAMCCVHEFLYPYVFY